MICAKFFPGRQPTQIVNLALVSGIFLTMILYNLPSSGNIHEKKVVEKLMQIRQCKCSKTIQTKRHEENIQKNETTCDKETMVRGPHQKVISFTFYEPTTKDKNERKYEEGIVDNLKLVKRYYPGYVMRLYYDVPNEKGETMNTLCNLACSEPMFDICDATKNPRFGDMRRVYPLIWRFLPALDQQVDIFFSRDLDSRINERELAAVKEFLNEPKKDIHVMRDHPAHSASIMGGMWGAKTARIRKELRTSFKKMFKDPLAFIRRDLGGYDQVCLKRYIWRWARHSAMQHDSYNCKWFLNSVPFPTQRIRGIGNYVGSVVSLNATLWGDKAECPVKCRPKDHLDWTYC